MNIKNLIFISLSCLVGHQSKALSCLVGHQSKDMDSFKPIFKKFGLAGVYRERFRVSLTEEVPPTEGSFEDKIVQIYGVTKTAPESAECIVDDKLLLIEVSIVKNIKYGNLIVRRLVSDAAERKLSFMMDVKNFVAVVVNNHKMVYLKTFDYVKGPQYFPTGIRLE